MHSSMFKYANWLLTHFEESKTNLRIIWFTLRIKNFKLSRIINTGYRAEKTAMHKYHSKTYMVA